ncbi:MAG: hypothetical protein L6Q68_18900, partial [Aquabacterium sp.]|nr:hypothetical protein [Aquabacterium sp.]
VVAVNKLTVERPAFADIFGALLNSMFLDNLDSDVERLERINRTVSLVQGGAPGPASAAGRPPGAWVRGDALRVRLEIEAQSDMTWVALVDPLPAGATILGSGLGRDSALATRGERREGSGWMTFEERGHDAWRHTWGFLPRGRHVVEYTMRLNSAGRLHLPPSRIEAMYAPDVFGELPLEVMEVRP